jgi:ubiquinone/menaquinone biosynthesis C-methylase UbiE
MSDWAREYFERGYAQRWGLPPASDEIRRQVNGLWEHLHLTPSSRVVDIGCGHGRHALALAQGGPHVVGVDSAAALLTQAQRFAADVGVRAHWVRGDMRRLPLLSACFDAAILMDAFGFFETESENEAVVAEAVRVLRPRGRFALKVVNGSLILARFRDSDREERDGTVVTLSRTLSLAPPRMTERIVVSGARGNGQYERRQRLYRSEELCALLERAGLSIIGVFGSAAGTPFAPSASSTIWIIGEW